MKSTIMEKKNKKIGTPMKALRRGDSKFHASDS